MPGESHPKVTRRQSEFGSMLNIAAGVLVTFALTADGAPPRLFVVAAVLAAAALVPSATVGRIFSLALLALSLFLAYNGTNAR